jgi:hypothetical protein
MVAPMSVAPSPPSPDAAADDALAAGAAALAAELGRQEPLDLVGEAGTGAVATTDAPEVPAASGASPAPASATATALTGEAITIDEAVAPRWRRRTGTTGLHVRTVPAQRLLRRRLVPPLATAAVFNIVLAVGDRLPAVDGLAYFETGRNFLSGGGYKRAGAPELHFPPVIPVSLRLFELATGSEMAALGAWNVVTSMAVVIALVCLAHRLWHDADVTVAAAWLSGMTAGLGPLFFRHGSGSEAAALAFLLWGLLLTLRGLDERSDARVPIRAAWLAGAGVFVGLAYLTRPEALLPGVVVGLATILWTWYHVRRPIVVRTAAAGTSSLDTVPGARGNAAFELWCKRGAPVVAAFALGAGLLVAPYAFYLHANTGKWSLTAKSQDVSIEAWRAVAEGDRRVRDKYVYALNDDGSLGSDTKSLTSLALEDPAGWVGIVGINAATIAETYSSPLWGYGPAWQLLPAPLVLLAVYELWRMRRHRATQLLAGVALVPVATCLAFFTLPRYLVVPTAVLALFAAKGVVRVCRALPRWGARPLVALVAVLVVMSAMTEARSFLPGGRTADPLDQRRAAHWVETHTPPGSRVMTRSFHVQAYAHRPIVALPVADLPETMLFARAMGVRYLVLDNRSPLYYTLQVSPAPPGLRALAVIGRSSRPIRVYELDPVPPPSTLDPIPLGYVSD